MQRDGLLDVIFELDQHLARIIQHAGEKKLAEAEVDRARFAREGHHADVHSSEVLVQGHEKFLAQHMQHIRALVNELYNKAYPPMEPDHAE